MGYHLNGEYLRARQLRKKEVNKNTTQYPKSTKSKKKTPVITFFSLLSAENISDSSWKVFDGTSEFPVPNSHFYMSRQ